MNQNLLVMNTDSCNWFSTNSEKTQTKRGDPVEIYELTEEHYQIAAKHDIPRKLAYHRFYNTGWDAMDAITRPKARPYLKELQAKARSNGIELTTTTIYCRKRDGWTDEDIITTEPNGRRKRNKEYLERALANGININTYKARLARGWTPERASTEEVQVIYSRYRRG